jgi:hypothetical protein
MMGIGMELDDRDDVADELGRLGPRLQEVLGRLGPRLQEVEQRLREITEENVRLKTAILGHYSKKADDRCWEDDLALYAAAGLGGGDNHVGDKEAMLRNCARFIDRRCDGGRWLSYAELEEDRNQIVVERDDAVMERDSARYQRDEARAIASRLLDDVGR